MNPGAGVKSNWNSYLGISDDTHCSPDANHVIHQNENQEILAADKANAIFYFSIASWNVNVKPHPDGSKLGNLENVQPTRANVSTGVYPLTAFGLIPITYGPTGGSAWGSSFCREVDH